MSYTKFLGHSRYSCANRNKKLTMFKGDCCDNCDCNDELMLSFDNSGNEYSNIIVCKNCITKFIDDYPDLKHNSMCWFCEGYFEKLTFTNISHNTPRGMKTEEFELCEECVKNLKKNNLSVLNECSI